MHGQKFENLLIFAIVVFMFPVACVYERSRIESRDNITFPEENRD